MHVLTEYADTSLLPSIISRVSSIHPFLNQSVSQPANQPVNPASLQSIPQSNQILMQSIQSLSWGLIGDHLTTGQFNVVLQHSSILCAKHI